MRGGGRVYGSRCRKQRVPVGWGKGLDAGSVRRVLAGRPLDQIRYQAGVFRTLWPSLD